MSGWRGVRLTGKRQAMVSVLVVPEGKGSVRAFRLPVLWLAAVPTLVGALAFLLSAALGVNGVQKVQLRAYQQQVEVLQGELDDLLAAAAGQEERLQQFALEAERLKARVGELEALSAEIRLLLEDAGATKGDLPWPPALWGEEEDFGQHDPADGVGGGSYSLGDVEAWAALTLERIRAALPERKAELEALLHSVEEYSRRHQHTPSVWPVKGRVTSEYGWRRNPFTQTRQHHDGIDIAAPAGTEVYAAAAGVVVQAGGRGGYGLTVVIDHGYGMRTLYAHNRRLAVRAGQRVSKGELIAFVGNTGLSTGPHLHYEVWVGGRSVDPRRFLPDTDL